MQNTKEVHPADSGMPFLCARHQGFEFWFEGMGWDLPRTNAMMAGRENTRYADICGEDIAAMDGVGWEFTAEPACFTATAGDAQVIASAWAGPMRTEEDEAGCNLTYAVDERYEGRSLAKLLTCLAFLACDQLYPNMGFANIECRADNYASIALAMSLGFEHDPEGDFTMPLTGGPDEVAFYCLRADPDVLRRHAFQTLQDRGLDELLALIQAARQPRSM